MRSLVAGGLRGLEIERLEIEGLEIWTLDDLQSLNLPNLIDMDITTDENPKIHLLSSRDCRIYWPGNGGVYGGASVDAGSLCQQHCLANARANV